MNAATATPEIETAIRSAREAAAAAGEQVIAHRVIAHPAGHLVVWLDLAAGRRARFATWDGSDLVAPLIVTRPARARASIRNIRPQWTGALLQDWTAA